MQTYNNNNIQTGHRACEVSKTNTLNPTVGFINDLNLRWQTPKNYYHDTVICRQNTNLNFRVR